MTQCIQYGEPAEKHVVRPDYKNWGVAGDLETKNVSYSLTATQLNLLKKLGVDLNKFKCVSAWEVQYYQGENIRSRSAVLMRFSLKKNISSSLEGEHFSMVFDSQAQETLGLTKMLTELDSKDFVMHQEALAIAIKFLKQVAPDLVANNFKEANLKTLPLGSRMVFPEPIIVDQVQVNWIDRHDEKISNGSQEVIVSGMKVKMFLPDLNLWVWVIIDKYGQVQTFERNISWGFDKMQRKTQMWLHDQCLVKQNVFAN